MDVPAETEGKTTEIVGADSDASGGSAKVRRKSPVWRRAFLRSLAITGSVVQSCRCAGVDQAYVYRVRARKPRFARAWERALDLASRRVADRAEAELRRRAIDGWDEPVYQKGEKVGTKRRYSDALLVKLVEAEMPEKYRKNHDGPPAGQVNVQVVVQQQQRRLLEDPEVAELACELAARIASPTPRAITREVEV